MKLEKKRILFLIAFIGLLIVNTFILNINGFTNLEENDEISHNHTSETKIIAINSDPTIQLTSTFPIFGYKVIATEKNPINRDETGTCFINQTSENMLDIEILSAFGTFTFSGIEIDIELLYNSKMTSYHIQINKPRQGFFMDLHLMSNISWVNMAFDGGDGQIIFDGIIDKGLSGYYPQSEIPSEFTQSYGELKTRSISTQSFMEQILQRQNNMRISKDENKDEINSPQAATITITNYGIYHKQWFASGDYQYHESLDTLWEDFTSIDICIGRDEPTEATVKSDLQYYNQDRLGIYVRDILAYTFMGFGVDDEYCAWAFYDRDVGENGSFVGEIPYSEIEDLWWEDDFYHVYPMDTIVLIDTCYSYLSFNGSSTVPYMAKAFVDYGAKSFTGSTFNVPVFLMPPNQQHGRALNSFWIRLSGARYEFYWIFFPVYGYHWVEAADESVYESGDGMCDWYNDWTYGGEDGEWQTYSDDPDYEIYLE